MVNIDLHKSIIINVLHDLYSDQNLRSVLGFKGGTSALLFYGLPRFSVDLDFDLLDLEKKEIVTERLKEILARLGTLTEVYDKRYTLFFLLNYQKGERNLKVEISKQPTGAEFEVKNYLGISMLVIKQADMVATKLGALLTRKNLATRDVFDVWFFLKNNWSINEKLLEERTGMEITDALEKAQEKIKKIKKTELLAGLGELLDKKQKSWIKDHLVEETIYYLKLYRSQLQHVS